MDDPRDQIARDDEEDVDADESAGKGREARMIQHDGSDRERAQAVYFGAVACRLHLFTPYDSNCNIWPS